MEKIFVKENKNLGILKNFFIAAAGCFIGAVALNVFIVPLKLYSGGILGISQLIRTGLSALFNIRLPGNYDLAGIVYFIINIPILYLAWEGFGKFLFLRTILMTVIFTFFLSVIPVPQTRVVSDFLTSCIVGGLLGGLGTGMTLYAGYTAGGLDVLGLYFTKKYEHFSVGKVAIILNIIVFTICLFLFNIEVVIYSMIFNTFAAMITDKVHAQNINVWVVIFTKKEGIPQAIMSKMNRGVTNWEGQGAYTGLPSHIHSTMINKFEFPMMKKLVNEIDPQAFIIYTEGSMALGNFEKRL